MKTRKSTYDDIPRMLEIYEYARAYMKKTGNPNQWIAYPEKELLLSDIEKGISNVVENDEGKVIGTYAFIIGEDPTYLVIEDGKWLNDNLYGTIHRIAGDGSEKGILHFVTGECFKEVSDIRIDTHGDNKVMQHLLDKEGYTYCGRIYVSDDVSDHSPRVAYQKSK